MKQTPKRPPELLEKILEGLQDIKLNELRRALQAALEAPTPNDDRLLWLYPPLHHRSQQVRRVCPQYIGVFAKLQHVQLPLT